MCSCSHIYFSCVEFMFQKSLNLGEKFDQNFSRRNKFTLRANHDYSILPLYYLINYLPEYYFSPQTGQIFEALSQRRKFYYHANILQTTAIFYYHILRKFRRRHRMIMRQLKHTIGGFWTLQVATKAAKNLARYLIREVFKKISKR